MKKRIGISVLLAVLLAAGAQAASDNAAPAYDTPQAPGEGYNYNIWGESVPAPAYYGMDGAYGYGLNQPADLCLRGDELYILDGAGGRVVVADAADGVHRRDIRPGEGAPSLEDAQGLWVTDEGHLYIALYKQRKIAVLDGNGAVLKVIEPPGGSLIPADFAYNPKRVAVQADGLIYVVADGSYQGIVRFTPDGQFQSFYGSNKVTVTAATLINRMWRHLLGDAQKERLEKTLPTDYSSLTIGPDGFLYSTTARATDSRDEIKKHSPAGNNVLGYNTGAAPGVRAGGNDYGDLETSYDTTVLVDTRFTDIAVDSRGFIYALDTQRGRVFQYDQNSNLLGVFGNRADHEAGFHSPVSLEAGDGRVYVLDGGRGEVLVFSPTPYAAALEEAALLHARGLFSQAGPAWETVRGFNTNLELCAAGLGRAALERGEYAQAMAYFVQARDWGGYNDAFLLRRGETVRKAFPLLFLLLIGLIAGFLVLLGRKARQGAFEPAAGGRQKLTPFQVMFHPSVGFDAMKDERMGSVRWSLLTLFLLFAVRMVSIRYTGFLFNPVRADTVNLPAELFQIMAVFAAWVVANWAVGTLIDSEGRVREIFNASAYALMPYILCQAVSVALSNVLALREGAFVSGVSAVGLYWSAAWMVMAVAKTNKFTAGKTILSVLLTLVGILFVLFLFIMFYSLIGQLGAFLSSLYNELQFRL